MKPAKQSLIRRLSNHRNRLARFYDNGGETCDRYTAVYLKPYTRKDGTRYSPEPYPYTAMSALPFHPQGFGQHGETCGDPCDWPHIAPLGRKNHLGRRIRFQDLPEDCQKLVLQDLMD